MEVIDLIFVIDGWRWEDGGNEVKEKGDSIVCGVKS